MELSTFTSMNINLSREYMDLLENETVTAEDRNPYKGIIDKLQFSMTIIGFLGNCIVYITLSKNGHMFTSPTILRLLKNQSIADSIVCLIGSIFVMQPPMWTTSNEKLSAFFCMVGISGFFVHSVNETALLFHATVDFLKRLKTSKCPVSTTCPTHD